MKNLSWLMTLSILMAGPLYGEKLSSPHLSELLRCRTIASVTERVACYDTNVAALQTAIENKELIVMDREDVHSAQRSLFGITAPQAKMFDRFGSPDLPELDTVITSADFGASGLVFTVADGGVWQQTDDYPLSGIKAGREVVIRHGALGSFFASFVKGPSVRVKRVR